MKTRASNRPAAAGLPPERVPPRLSNMRQTAEYLGCSFWTAREYILQGLIQVVDMPPLRTCPEGEAAKRDVARST